MIPSHNQLQLKQITTFDDSGCTSELSDAAVVDPELASLVAAWPTLSAPIKAAFLALLSYSG
jgi:hypothetical protein